MRNKIIENKCTLLGIGCILSLQLNAIAIIFKRSVNVEIKLTDNPFIYKNCYATK